MEIKQYQAAMEAVLFASGEPVTSGRLSEVLDLDEETTIRLADDLMQDINTRGEDASVGRSLPALYQS